MTHRAQRLSRVCFWQNAQEGGLSEFDFEGFIQGVVEDGIACLVDEGCQEDEVGLSQHGPSEKEAPRSDGGNHEGDCDKSNDDKTPLVPKFKRWRYGN